MGNPCRPVGSACLEHEKRLVTKTQCETGFYADSVDMMTDNQRRAARDSMIVTALRSIEGALGALSQDRAIRERTPVDESIKQRLESVQFNLRDIVLMRESAIKAAAKPKRRKARP